MEEFFTHSRRDRMNIAQNIEFPAFLKDFTKQRIQSGFSDSVCIACNSNCCTSPGFAILENVLKIYDLYEKSKLHRDDYEFVGGFDFGAFIYKYFDRVLFNGSLLAFFPKVFDDNRNLISVPPWNYYQSRDYIQRRIEKKGCIFLNKMFDPSLKDNFCILHNNKIYEEITEKPIDCVFLTCNTNKKVIEPTRQETAVWLSVIDYYFPNSKERFNKLCPGLPD